MTNLPYGQHLPSYQFHTQEHHQRHLEAPNSLGQLSLASRADALTSKTCSTEEDRYAEVLFFPLIPTGQIIYYSRKEPGLCCAEEEPLL